MYIYFGWFSDAKWRLFLIGVYFTSDSQQRFWFLCIVIDLHAYLSNACWEHDANVVYIQARFAIKQHFIQCNYLTIIKHPYSICIRFMILLSQNASKNHFSNRWICLMYNSWKEKLDTYTYIRIHSKTFGISVLLRLNEIL